MIFEKTFLILVLSVSNLLYGQNCVETNIADKYDDIPIIDYSDYSNNKNIQDLNFLIEQLEENHPNFDKYKYQELVLNEADKISHMDETEFNFEVLRILASIKDAHTQANLVDLSGDRMIPIWQIKHYSDGWYIDGVHKDLEDYLGLEIVSIGEFTIDDILEMSRRYISHETDYRLEYVFTNLIKNSAFLKYFGVIENDITIPMTLRDEYGNIKKVNIPTFAIDDYEQYQYGAWISFPETWQNSGPNYYLKPLKDDALFIQYSYCYERDDCTVQEFLQQVVTELEKRQYNTVIFDLRFNGGGMFSLFEPIIDEIGRYKQERNFDLYCLIGKDTFSTGVMHALQLGEYGATFVGRPTGGIVNFYADTVNFKLPNSGISVSCSTAYNEMMPNYEGLSLEPDINIGCYHRDIANGTDCDIQAIFSNENEN